MGGCCSAEAIDADLDWLARLHSRGLRSLGPVWSIPVLWLVRGERTSARGVLGATLAVAGAMACSAAARAP